MCKAGAERSRPETELISSQETQEESQIGQTRSSEKRQITLLLSQDDHQNTTETVPPVGRKATTAYKNVSSSKTQPSIQTTSSRMIDVPSSYVSILSSAPPVATHRSAVTSTNDPPSTSTQRDIVDVENPSAVWNHAMHLAGTGNSEEAAKFFRVHEALSLAMKTKRHGSSTVKTIEQPGPREVDSASSGQADETFSEGGLSFIPGAVTSHMDIGFTPFFDKNLRELKGPIPLTIFNRHWQELANSYHVEKRVKVENLTRDITTYTGYPYPHEMTQSYATWNTNYRNFVRTLQDVYQFKRFAEWAEVHQANVEFYHTRDNWMTAFRYDIKIRLNAFAFRVSQNGTSAPPDISQRREDIAAICFAETRRLDEASFEDNPYAKGGVKFGYDWTTGLPRSSNNHHSNNAHGANSTNSASAADHGQNNSHSYQFNQGSKRPNRQNQNGGGGRQRGGYQGNNFDPNHVAKKAATARNAPAPPTT